MDKKTHFLLDLDQTLISAEPSEEYNFKKNKDKSKKFIFHDMDGYYLVFERPGLQDFLTYLFDNFTVSIWTAASKDYALFVIDKIILGNHPNRKLDYVFFSYHCEVSKIRGKGSKDLSLLYDWCKLPGYTKDNTVILDDFDEVYKTQKENCIIAKPFEFTDEGSENDKFLKDLVVHLQKIKSSTKVDSTVKEINSSIK